MILLHAWFSFGCSFLECFLAVYNKSGLHECLFDCRKGRRGEWGGWKGEWRGEELGVCWRGGGGSVNLPKKHDYPIISLTMVSKFLYLLACKCLLTHIMPVSSSSLLDSAHWHVHYIPTGLLIAMAMCSDPACDLSLQYCGLLINVRSVGHNNLAFSY